jgi:hypothetical protein
MKTTLHIFISIISLVACSSNKKTSSTNSSKTGSIVNLKEYTVLDSAVGDLNMDRMADKIIIYKSLNEINFGETKRPLEILIGQVDGSYKMAETNDKIALCYSCGGVYGDPYEDVIIENGSFTVSHYGGSNWRWSRAITFSFVKDQNTWVLTDDSGISYNVSEEEKNTETLINNQEDFGKVKFKDFDNEKGK